jgi:hypothetical protein
MPQLALKFPSGNSGRLRTELNRQHDEALPSAQVGRVCRLTVLYAMYSEPTLGRVRRFLKFTLRN